jgi:GxxExxY protein
MNHKDHKDHKDHERRNPLNHKDHKDHEDHERRNPLNHKDHKDHEDRKRRFEGWALSPEHERIVTAAIGAGLAVHRELGPGFIEQVYDRAMCVEMRLRNLRFERQKPIDVMYRGETLCCHHLDLVVEDVVVVEVKAVKEIRPIHEAQILSYLKAAKYRAGLLMNFNVKMFVDGLHRFVR